MGMHMGRKAAAVGLAAAAVCGAAGTALAASGAGSHAATAQPATARSAASASAASSTQSSWPPAKTTMPAIAAKLGRNEKEMVYALDDMKNSVIGNPKVNRTNLESVEIKVLAVDLRISADAAKWVVEEINGGYVWTNVNWGFGK